MPRICCACGEPAGTATLTASGAGRGAARFSKYRFPVCDRCAVLFSTVHRRRRMSCLFGLGLSLVMCIVAAFLAQRVGETAWSALDPLVGVLLALAGITVVAALVVQWLVGVVGLEREAREIYRRVSEAVQVKRYDPGVVDSGYVTLAFVSQEFAQRFEEMNAGVVMPGR